MATRDLGTRIVRRGERVGVSVAPELTESLRVYLDLLARWNAKINLTALALTPPTDEAIDRLLVESLIAARHVRPADRLLLDIGSGGGSPALPLLLARPHLRGVLVEVKVRKAAFLREAVRTLELARVEVENRRFEELFARSDLHEAVDIVTLRAVRADRRLWTGIRAFLSRGGRVFWFGGSESGAGVDSVSFDQIHIEHNLAGRASSRLTILRAVDR
ncbi:MAG TPA: RsmG family class I SAM-dependent methyltransferase [Vicinamibacterales bacterium]|nr:RsmG family class I SAM-dependent methyltransferase [Vicinamibacterales bacterium]